MKTLCSTIYDFNNDIATNKGNQQKQVSTIIRVNVWGVLFNNMT